MARQAKTLGSTLVPLASQGEHDQPWPPGALPPPSWLRRLLDTTCCEGMGRRACPKPGNRGHTPPRGAQKAGSPSHTTSPPPPEPPNRTGEFLGRPSPDALALVVPHDSPTPVVARSAHASECSALVS